MTSYINACSPSGNGHRITLPGTDLIMGNIDNVFVYPTVDIDRLQNALRQTLSFWPILTGRIIVDNDDQYMIECSDNSIPFTYTENNQLKCWPDLPVVVDDMAILQPFIDFVQYKPDIEPLLRFKVTHLLLSNEYVMGTSFSHMVGDADSNIHFLNDLSRIYQHLEPALPRPVFARDLPNKEEPDFSFPPTMELSEKSEKREIVRDRIVKGNSETDPVHISFSSRQMTQLYSLAGNNNEITMHDALCAYIILLMNTYVFPTTNEYIRCVRITVNYRGVSDSLAPEGHVANSFTPILSSDFPNPLSLSSIAQTIRQTIKAVRNEDFLKKWIVSVDIVRRQLLKDGRVGILWIENEAVLNSNFKYDWANQVNLGMVNQCRFHTALSCKFYFRIFRLNPIRGEDGNWTRDNGGVEIASRLLKGEGKEKFLEAWQKDIEENFANIK